MMTWVSFPRHILSGTQSTVADETNLPMPRENLLKSMLGITVLLVHVSFPWPLYRVLKNLQKH